MLDLFYIRYTQCRPNGLLYCLPQAKLSLILPSVQNSQRETPRAQPHLLNVDRTPIFILSKDIKQSKAPYIYF